MSYAIDVNLLLHATDETSPLAGRGRRVSGRSRGDARGVLHGLDDGHELPAPGDARRAYSRTR